MVEQYSGLLHNPTFPPPGWYLMLSMEPILERTFFRSGVGALMVREFLGARGTGGFFSSGVCLGTGGLVMTRRRCAASPLVEAAGVAGVVVERGRRAAQEKAACGCLLLLKNFLRTLTLYGTLVMRRCSQWSAKAECKKNKKDTRLCKVLMATFYYGAIKIT